MGDTTKWDPRAYAKNARFVADLGQPLLELLAPRQGELIMDLGCGDGALTEKIAARGAGVAEGGLARGCTDRRCVRLRRLRLHPSTTGRR